MSDKLTAIFDATLTLISERGFHNTPMSLIAKTSGVSTGTIYHYFASKEELINELYRKVKIKAIRAMLAGYSEDLSFRERFLRVWFNVVHYLPRHPTEGAFLEQFENSPYLKPSLQEAYLDEIGCLFSFFEQGIQEGVFKDLPLDVLFDLAFQVAISLAKRQIAGAIVLDDELMQATADACWDAIRK